MRRIRRSWLLGPCLAAVACFQVGAASAAECKATLADGSVKDGRTTDGEIRQISAKKLVIAKSGEMLELVPHEHTVVSGLKDSVKKLKKNDYVKVCFHRSMTKKDPRYAWTIEVVTKPDDGAVDVD
jgi:ribosomal protein S1